MRILLAAILSCVAFIANAQATYTLTSDLLDAHAVYVIVRVDGAPVTDCGAVATPCMTAGVIDYDVTAIVVLGNPFQIDASACNVLEQCSDFSLPLVIIPSAPAMPGGTRIQVLPDP